MYTVFKFIHIVAAIVWIGSGLSLGLLQIRLARSNDRDVLLAVSEHMNALGSALVGPSALLTLVAGVVMVAGSGLSFGAFWIVWGFVGIVVAMALGGGLGRRLEGELLALLKAGTPGTARVDVLRKRLTLLHIVVMLILLSVVWAMVFKPTL